MFGKPSSYIDIDGIKKQMEEHRAEMDLMILHEDKGIIFIQVTRTYYFSFLSFARHKDLSGLQGEWSCPVGEVQLLPRTVDPEWSAGRMELSSPALAEDRRP